MSHTPLSETDASSPPTSNPSTPPNRSTHGMLLMVGGMAILPMLDACAKWLGQTLPATEVSAGRFLIQMSLLTPLFYLMGYRLHWGVLSISEAARGFCLAMATWLFFLALKSLPMAEAISIFFIEPMILTILAALILKERFRSRRIIAIIIGFIGAIIVIQPSFDIFGWPALLPLGTAFFFALYMIITRIVAQAKHPIEAQISMSFFALLTILILAGINDYTALEATDWRMPTAMEWGVMLILGMVATTGHLMVVFALQRADAGLLAPFQYLEVVTASLLGYVIFGDIPNQTTILGVSIIIGSGLYLIHRERLATKSPSSAHDS